MDNYEVAVETAERCCQANTQFAEISEVRNASAVTRAVLNGGDTTPSCYFVNIELKESV